MEPTQNTSVWQQQARAISWEFAKGSFFGGIVVSVLTPAIYFKNMVMGGEPIVWANCGRGIGLNAFSVVPTTAVAMSVNELLIRLFDGNISENNKFAISAFSGGVSGLVCNPMEALVQNLQASKQQTTMQQIWKMAGYKRLLRGSCATFARESLYFTGYNVLTSWLALRILSYTNNPVLATGAGAVFAGIFVGALTTPLDFIRAQKQSQVTSRIKALTVQQIFANHGWKGFMRGWRQRSLLVCAPATLMMQAKNMLPNNA